MELPDALRASLDSYPDGLGRRWASELAGRIGAAEERWGLVIGEPFQPGGVTSWVAPARRADGTDCVYKITVPHDEAIGEDVALRAYGADGAVALLAAAPEAHELLLERAEPGHDLWSVADDDERLDVACDVMRRLWRPSGDDSIRSVGATARAWADVTERRLVTSEVPWVTDPIERGVDLLRALPNDPTGRVLVHGDFHPGNVLAARREPWLAIDPKPLVGDPAFEPIQLLTQQEGRITEPPPLDDVAVRVEGLAGRLDLDAERIVRWGIARCAEWSMWSWEHGDTIDAAVAYTWARTLDRLA